MVLSQLFLLSFAQHEMIDLYVHFQNKMVKFDKESRIVCIPGSHFVSYIKFNSINSKYTWTLNTYTMFWFHKCTLIVDYDCYDSYSSVLM